MAEKTIYELELHEILRFSDAEWVRRVPGGWIYYYRAMRDLRGRSTSTSVSISGTFVPYDNEFSPLKKVLDQLTTEDVWGKEDPASFKSSDDIIAKRNAENELPKSNTGDE